MLLNLVRNQYLVGQRLASLTRFSSASTIADVKPPKKRHRDSISVLRALNSCVEPVMSLPEYQSLSEPSLGNSIMRRSLLQAKASGRNAARHVARQFVPNDLSVLATELPRIDAFMPLQTGESIRKELEEGQISETEAMNRLLLLLSPKEAWALYVDTNLKDAWSSDHLHRLLDLLCATNSGEGGSMFFEGLPFVDRGKYPDPDELYFAEENRVISNHITMTKQNLTSSSEEDQSIEPADRDTGPCPWAPEGPAETLWSEQPEVLRSHAAYASLIRGAARFGNSQRAWQLADEIGLKSLSLSTLHSLIRCSSSLTSQDVWPYISRVLEVVPRPTTETFASALFALSKTVHRTDVIAKALGLMKKARLLGITPSLGMNANMIRIVIDSHPLTTHKFGLKTAYRATELLSDMLVEMEISWAVNPPSRGDIFTLDDYEFFNVAMICAVNESNMVVAQRLYDLINHVDGDKRFLFLNSLMVRHFYCRYCSMVLRKGGAVVGSESEKMMKVADLFKAHRQVALVNMNICGKFVWKFKNTIAIWKDLFAKLTDEENGNQKLSVQEETVLDLQLANSIAFTILGDILFDYVASINRLPPKLPPPLVDAIFIFSNCDAWLLGRSPEGATIRLISEEAAECAGKTAKATLDWIKAQEPRVAKLHKMPLSAPELAGIVKMALSVTAFNATENALGSRPTEQTVHQRETNERALTTALELLLIGKRYGVMTDIGAIELAKSLWLTTDVKDGQISNRLWTVLEYMSGLKYLSGRCMNHPFMESLVGILEQVRKDMQTSFNEHSSLDQQVSGQMVSGRTESDTDSFSRLHIIGALLSRIKDSRMTVEAREL